MTSIDRRTMLAGVTLGGISGISLASEPQDFSHPLRNGTGAHEQIGLLLYPGMTVLDMIGPYHFLCFMGGAHIHLVTNQPRLEPVTGDAGMGIMPTTTMADCPSGLDMVLVPGGTTGTLRAARDPATIEFLRAQAPHARFVTSVCSGSLILGAAGLLRGKRATSHWNVVDCLSQFGAIPTHRRVVEDGNVITAAGVSAGLDAGIVIVERFRGLPLAEAAVLATEYAPEPPLRGGSPATARPAVLGGINDALRSFTDQARTLRIL